MAVSPDPRTIQTRTEFAQALTGLRHDAGLTVRDVARLSGASVSTLGGYFSGRHLPSLAPRAVLEQILTACEVEDRAVREAWAEALARVRSTPGPRPAGTPVPYRGLSRFEPQDAAWFFGRDHLVATLTDRVNRLARDGGGVLFVVGPSGSGKSSVLRAGLLGTLTRPESDRNDPPSWRGVLLTPGATPGQRLAAALAPVSTPALTPAPTPDGAVPDDVPRLLIVVDQLEEMFTACSDESERRRFLRALLPGPRRNDSPAVVVVAGLRADFYSRAIAVPELARALSRSQIIVGPLTRAEVRAAIEEPARKAHLSLEAGLTEVLLGDLAPAVPADGVPAHDPGALPLLSHCLLSAWQRSRRGQLTVADYTATGGIHGAVAATAEQVFAQLSTPQQLIARRLFRRLVTVGDDTAATRRQVGFAELHQDDPDDEADLRLVIETFVADRMLTVGDDILEITHEALVSAWPRLRGWLDEDRAGLATHRQLTLAAKAWADDERDPQLLYRGGRLTTARDWAERVGPSEVNPAERAFLAAGLARQDAERTAERRRTRRLQRLVTALVIALTTSITLGAIAAGARNDAAAERDRALSRQVAGAAARVRPSDAALAAQLSLVAYRIAPTTEARSALLDSSATPTPVRLLGPPGAMQAVVTDPRGTLVASAGEAGVVRWWSLADRGRPQRRPDLTSGSTSTLFALALSPDGRTLAAAGSEGVVRRWDVTDPANPAVLPELPGAIGATVYTLAFSPDGHTLAAGAATNAVHVWDVSERATPRPWTAPLIGPKGAVQSLAFSPDGRTLAAGSVDRAVHRWELSGSGPTATGTPAGTGLTGAGLTGASLTGPTHTVFAVAFSPDGRTLAAGSRDGTVHLWQVPEATAAGARTAPVAWSATLSGPTSWVNGIAFSPDGTRLSAAGSDNQVWTWELRSPAALGAVAGTTSGTITGIADRPHPGPVTAVTYLADGATLVTADLDGAARLWPVPGPLLPGVRGGVYQVAYDADGDTLASSSTENEVLLWDTTDPAGPVRRGVPVTGPVPTDQRLAGSAALSPDGRTVAAGGMDGAVRLWDVSDPAVPVPLGGPLSAGSQIVEWLTFSPDGRTLAAGGDDTTINLWDVADPARPTALVTGLAGPGNYVFSLAFSPDGHALAVGTADGTIGLWDLTDPRHPRPFGIPWNASAGYVFSVAFSPDGHTLASGAADKQVRLWDVTDRTRPTQLGAALAGPTNKVNAVAFSPDGRTLAAGSEDHSLWLYDVSRPRSPRALATVSSAGGRILALAYRPDGRSVAAGSPDRVTIWDTDPDRTRARACATLGDPLTRTEWELYLPDTAYRAPCS